MITLLLCLLFAVSAQAATTLSGHLTADDGFVAYISTSDTALGDQISSGSTWTNTYSLTTSLTASIYYLHINAYDVYGSISGFIGDFNLSDTGYQFSNSKQNLVTGTSFWKVSETGFGGVNSQVTASTGDFPGSTYKPPISGLNGCFPWGFKDNISKDASWIWVKNGDFGSNNLYFSTKITAVPEPTSLLAAFSILAPTGLLFRRRK